MQRVKHEAVVRIAILLLVLYGIALTALRLHGYSFPIWHKYIDESPQNEVLFGETKLIRSDDWVGILPQMLSQRLDNPPFPVRSSLIGDGQYDMCVNFAMPVRDWTTLFRPQVWGFFVSGDTGMSFNWWFNVFGILIASFLVLMKVTHGDRMLSACGAVALLYSPFAQSWSLNCAPSIIYACGVFLAAVRVLERTTAAGAFLSARLLAWFLTAFLFTFSYMPYLVVLAYLFVFLLAGFAANSRSLKQFRSIRLAGVALGTLIAGALVYSFMDQHAGVIQIIRDSSYPGQRLATGGEATWTGIFGSPLKALKLPPQTDLPPPWAMIYREQAFFFLSPLVIAAFFWDWVTRRAKPDGIQIGVALFIVLLLVWCLFGFPERVCRWTLLDRLTASRAFIGLGIADWLLLATYLARRRSGQPSSMDRPRNQFILIAAWLGFNVFLAIGIRPTLPDYSIWMMASGVAAMTFLGYLALASPRWAILSIAAVSVWLMCDFNPLSRGGTEFIQQNPLSKKIREIDSLSRQNGRPSVWLTYDDVIMPNLFRMIGVRALNGLHTYPQFAFWTTLDPEGKHRKVWNRYAHIGLTLPKDKTAINIGLVQQDIILLEVHPENGRLGALGVTHILCNGNASAAFDQIPGLKKLFTYRENHLYEVTRRSGR